MANILNTLFSESLQFPPEALSVGVLLKSALPRQISHHSSSNHLSNFVPDIISGSQQVSLQNSMRKLGKHILLNLM